MAMTELTCQEVNERIAWLRLKAITPDYCHDWTAAGLLFEEFSGDLWRTYPEDEHEWYCEVEVRGGKLLTVLGYGDTAPEAIARAWLMWKEQHG